MSNYKLITEVIRLGFRSGPFMILRYSDLFHLARAVHNGHAKLTKDGRKTMLDFLAELKKGVGES